MNPGPKAYRILLDDGSIIVSRDVTFDERPVDTIPNPEPLGGVEDAIDPPDLSPEEMSLGPFSPELCSRASCSLLWFLFRRLLPVDRGK